MPIQFRVGPSDAWTESGIVPIDRQLVAAHTPDGTVQAKFGDGMSKFDSLPELHVDPTQVDSRITAQKGVASGVAALDANAKVPLAQVPDLALTTNGKRPVGKSELVFNVRDYGAKGDGTANDAPAISAALSAASAAGGRAVTYLPPGNYAVAASVTFPANANVQGAGATLTWTGASVFTWATINPGVTIDGLTFNDPGALVTGTVLSMGSGVAGARFTNVTVRSAKSIAFVIHATVSDVLVDRCVVDGCATAFDIAGDTSHITVRACEISNWSTRGIYLYGRSEGSPSRVLIEHNRIASLAPGGSVRYPIFATQASGPVSLSEIRVNYNTIIGPGLAYANGGTADQISLSSVDGFEVIGNTSTRGGDMGITVAKDSNHGVVALNRTTFNMHSGIAVWTNVSAVTITGNVCMNNGQLQDSAYGQAGIRFAGTGTDVSGHDIVVAGNVLGDDQTAATQQYGASIRGATRVQLGPDIDAGNGTALYGLDAVVASTGITRVTTQAVT